MRHGAQPPTQHLLYCLSRQRKPHFVRCELVSKYRHKSSIWSRNIAHVAGDMATHGNRKWMLRCVLVYWTTPWQLQPALSTRRSLLLFRLRSQHAWLPAMSGLSGLAIALIVEGFLEHTTGIWCSAPVAVRPVHQSASTGRIIWRSSRAAGAPAEHSLRTARFRMKQLQCQCRAAKRPRPKTPSRGYSSITEARCTRESSRYFIMQPFELCP